MFGNGARVIFTTTERLVAADLDSSSDLYERTGSTTTLLSTGSTGGNGEFGVLFEGASADGTRVFFLTNEQLMPSDTDTMQDAYERVGGLTTHVTSVPNLQSCCGILLVTANGTPALWFNRLARVSPPAPSPRPRGATPVRDSPRSWRCSSAPRGNANRTHGPPLAFPSCAPPVPLRQPPDRRHAGRQRSMPARVDRLG